jgi:RNA polymerase sigma factor (sigma-70 family)
MPRERAGRISVSIRPKSGIDVAGPPLQTNAAYAIAAEGDETARLYDKYARQLYRYCLARLRSPEEAEDAVQNTFIRVHGALRKGTTPRFEAAWLYKIAHNVCLTRIEVRGRRAEHELSADLDDFDVAAPETESDALIGLEAALASMPKNLRDAILLREWQGLTYAEIADSLDTSVPAVETLIFRARRHLASALQPTGVGLLDVGTLYGAVRIVLARLRGALGTVGPAKLAVGVAAVTLGTAGVTTAVVDVEAHPPAHDPAPSSKVTGAVPAAHEPAPRTSTARAEPPPRTAAAPRSAVPIATGRVSSALSTAGVTAPTPEAASTSVTTPDVTTTVASIGSPPSTPSVVVPAVQTPAVAVPTVAAPTVAAPTVSVPAVEPPALQAVTTVVLPTVTVPALP